MTAAEFVAELINAAPEAQGLVDEHRCDDDRELLLHLLMADVLRLASSLFERGEASALRRLLDVIDTGLRFGDEYVGNAICVSFVELAGPWEPAIQPFMASWPDALQAEASRQLHGNPSAQPRLS